VAERMFGLETEYAFTGLGPDGVPLNRAELLERIMVEARQSLVCLPDAGGNTKSLFLQNGARFYVDIGEHPEMATPECTEPWELVRYQRAGEQILLELTDRVQSRLPRGSQVFWFLCNVDYSGNRTTWGCHESYLHQADRGRLADQLIPHLVTRIIYSGAGGFNNLRPGLEFVLSPRAFHLTEVISSDSTGARGIFHTKDEPLCGGGHHRLHVLCGESLCSQIALWLKVGATALVVALIEAGLAPARGVRLRDPLQALRTVAADPSCRAPLALADGKQATAREIQQRYLERAEDHLNHPVMPSWAAEVCRQWRRMLDLLRDAPESVATVLDWAIKRSLYVHAVRQRGLSWESIEQSGLLLGALNAALPELDLSRPDLDSLVDADNPALEEVAALTPQLRRCGLGWDRLAGFQNLRAELLEMETRFGQLGPQGIFSQLDRRGLLAHHAPGVESIPEAMVNPPARGRARLRGEAIRRLAGHHPAGRCTWEAVIDSKARRVLDLSDPFPEQERWRDQPEDERRSSGDMAAQLLRRLFERGVL